METEKKDVKKKNVAKGKKTEITSFKDLEGKFLLVRVGNDALPANTDQIEDVRKKLVKLFEENNINCVTFVTHHYVDMTIIEKDKIA